MPRHCSMEYRPLSGTLFATSPSAVASPKCFSATLSTIPPSRPPFDPREMQYTLAKSLHFPYPSHIPSMQTRMLESRYSSPSPHLPHLPTLGSVDGYNEDMPLHISDVMILYPLHKLTSEAAVTPPDGPWSARPNSFSTWLKLDKASSRLINASSGCI